MRRRAREEVGAEAEDDSVIAATPTCYPVLGALSPHSSQLPGSRFLAFESSIGVHGLACVDKGELHLLAVAAVTSGIGQFRRFIAECKQHYRFIRVWAVMNDDVRPMLVRYGFQRGHDVDNYGEMQEVWDWNAPRP